MTATFKSVTPNLMARSVDATIAFYERNLGFAVAMAVPLVPPYAWAMLVRDGVTLMFQKAESLIEEYPVLGRNAVGSTFTLFVEVAHAGELYNKLKRRDDIIFLKGLGHTTYNKWEFAIQDNNGYVLVFASDAG